MRRGFVVWFTGLSGSGKSTIAGLVDQHLQRAGVPVELLDGDRVRAHLSKDLGFSRAARDTNVLRIGWVAGLLARHGVGVVVAAISPYAATRGQARDLAENFAEVFVDAPLDECARRDVKGLYARARAGEIPCFTGVSDPYEPPPHPELHLRTAEQTPAESAAQVVAFLAERGWTSSGSTRRTGSEATASS